MSKETLDLGVELTAARNAMSRYENEVELGENLKDHPGASKQAATAYKALQKAVNDAASTISAAHEALTARLKEGE